jgi:hypothetical protein
MVAADASATAFARSVRPAATAAARNSSAVASRPTAAFGSQHADLCPPASLGSVTSGGASPMH